MTGNFGAATAPVHRYRPPSGMAMDDSVFPRRPSSLRVSLPLCQHTSPGPAWASSLSPGVLQPPEALVCSARPVLSRGAVASRSWAPMRWEDFILLRIKNFYPYPSPKYLDCQEESVSQHNCRKSRRIPDLTEGYGLQTETLTNTGQKHKYVNTGGSHPASMSL